MRLPESTSDTDLGKFVASVVASAPRPEVVAEIASFLASSGETITWQCRVADIASTGGPGSLSTLLPPLFLRALGETVVKLAVPGRPAGAIDALGTLPGYRVNLNRKEVADVVRRCSYAHFLADQRFAPMDAVLFNWRKANGALAVPVLVASSLLSKKLAVGVTAVGLDVRVGDHGNFGVDLSEARTNARLFCAAGSLLGLDATAFITTAPAPAQPFVGRGESLLSLAAVLGLSEPVTDRGWLDEHAADCARMAFETATKVATPEWRELLPAARAALAEHLEAQGCSLDALLDRIREIQQAPRLEVRAQTGGYFEIDLAGLRDALVTAQLSCPGVAGAHYSDPGGVELRARPGQQVTPGTVLARVRGVDQKLILSIGATLAVQKAPRHVMGRAPVEVIRA